MGIINHDSYDTNYGIGVTNSYISVGTNSLEVSKNGTDYKLRYIATIWASKKGRETDKKSLQSLVRAVTLDSTQLTSGVYVLAYADLKTVFTNTTDV
jgi:hypothetical protein